ncbi:DPY19L3 isoform 1 [Pan troglodytes]|uniref:Dpy-19 like C-mannosyltransferase 3 n=2 Tax=Homininae TaxID=207598 RepID=Q8N6Q4_HUMAN|nr:Dpy-19-like 3 (C. elegans) [Homo sapiens]KAI2590137.1 dpy-19 like C-mannosyltransferase 3 [Homo sapiens]KAI4041797.1 dpy-19 like C-mannosyltransferase 3 [Homo sapiens]PNI38055.1 DPY19L3 isoform 1 [Pan troglodytes]
MMSIRQRREIRATEVSEDFPAQEENVKLENKLPSGCTSRRLWKILSLTIGGTIALCIGLLTSVYLATLHENDLWFSNIKVWSFFDHCIIHSVGSPVVSHVDE